MGATGRGSDVLEGARALVAGTAYVDLSFWHKIWVVGADATEWLHSLVTADVASLGEGEAAPSLLLSPTGRVRAAFTVTPFDGGLLLLQDPIQSRSAADLLAPYVLSSDVDLRDRTADLALFSVPGLLDPPSVPGASLSSPSCLGVGVDILASAEMRPDVATGLGTTLRLVGDEEVEAWRIMTGRPRVGVDVSEEDLPHEGGLEAAVAFDKGCFLGQEAVARARNLGHPRRLLLALRSAEPVSTGDIVVSGGREAGEVTSAIRSGSASLVLAKVRWEARNGPFSTALERTLEPREVAG